MHLESLPMLAGSAHYHKPTGRVWCQYMSDMAMSGTLSQKTVQANSCSSRD